MSYIAKNGKFKFTMWLREEWPELWESLGCADMSFNEQLIVAKTTYYIKLKSGQIYNN